MYGRYNLAKFIIIFVSNEKITEDRLSELIKMLESHKYPENVINRAFHNARLQGTAPLKANSNNIPLKTTYYTTTANVIHTSFMVFSGVLLFRIDA